MERFLRLYMPNWLRRLVAYPLAVIPTIICLVIFKGNAAKVEQLLVFSQAFLSITLPFCLIPLQLVTSNKDSMGPFHNKTWVNIISWVLIIILSILSVCLIVQTFQEL